MYNNNKPVCDKSAVNRLIIRPIGVESKNDEGQ
jgi:hypothetical protein